METINTYNKVFNQEIKPMIGGLIEIWPERNHTTIYYEANPAKLNDYKCTICHKENPVIIRYERDHWCQEFYDAFCLNCAPQRIINSLRGIGG